MSADNRASVVGQNVYKEGEQVPFGVVAGHLGETEGVHYYSVQTESGTHIYDGADLRLMTHEGLVPFAAYRDDLPPDRVGAPGTPHPFEQVGKAGAEPVASAQGPEGLTTPAYGGTVSAADSDYAEYQDFLRWRAGIRDYGDSTDATPLSPAESKAADKGAIEGESAPTYPGGRVPKEDTTGADTSTNGGKSPTSAATSGEPSGGTVDPELPPMESGGATKTP